MKVSLAITTLVAMALVGCAEPADSGPTGAADSYSASSTSSPSERPSDEGVVTPLGETVTTPRGSDVTVYGAVQSPRRAAPPAGTVWSAVDVKFCVTPVLDEQMSPTVLRDEFVLLLSDGTKVEAATTGPTGPGERFSDRDARVTGGDCIRAPVVFAVPEATTGDQFVLDTPVGDLVWELTG